MSDRPWSSHARRIIASRPSVPARRWCSCTAHGSTAARGAACAGRLRAVHLPRHDRRGRGLSHRHETPTTSPARPRTCRRRRGGRARRLPCAPLLRCALLAEAALNTDAIGGWPVRTHRCRRRIPVAPRRRCAPARRDGRHDYDTPAVDVPDRGGASSRLERWTPCGDGRVAGMLALILREVECVQRTAFSSPRQGFTGPVRCSSARDGRLPAAGPQPSSTRCPMPSVELTGQGHVANETGAGCAPTRSSTSH